MKLISTIIIAVMVAQFFVVHEVKWAIGFIAFGAVSFLIGLATK